MSGTERLQLDDVEMIGCVTAVIADPRPARPTPCLWPTKARSERGGSWVGPADLCRSSFRRGRPPGARGRCLGFRCINDVRGG